MPLPPPLVGNVLLTEEFLYPRSRLYPYTESWEMGGRGIGDPQGMTDYSWRAWVDMGDKILLRRADDQAPPPLELMLYAGDSGVSEIDVSFDQIMNPCYVYVANGVARLSWHDPQGGRQFMELEKAVQPRISLDDKSNSAVSDVIVAYGKDAKLCWRAQRESYSIEHVLDIPFSGKLRKIGMGVGNRFLFEQE